jgi:hypothetical protein
MNYYIKKYIEFKEFIIDILICCCHYINKKKVNIKYYNLDDFDMEANCVPITPNENSIEITI